MVTHSSIVVLAQDGSNHLDLGPCQNQSEVRSLLTTDLRDLSNGPVLGKFVTQKSILNCHRPDNIGQVGFFLHEKNSLWTSSTTINCPKTAVLMRLVSERFFKKIVQTGFDPAATVLV
jgi:hypothetical protein